ncbi:MAG: ATP12 family protein [Bdellovibrionales bacterium]
MAFKESVFSVSAEGAGFAVRRAGKTLETPLHYPLEVPSRALAEAIVREFDTQGEKTDLRKMPHTQMALTAIDVTRLQREDILKSLRRYAGTELICQRAEAPPDLVAAQEKAWNPYIDWCRERFAANLQTGSGILPFEQKEDAVAALCSYIGTLDPFFLTGLGAACGALGSLVLGLALMERQAGVAEVFEAAELDALWQIRKWGDDPASQGRHGDIKRDLAVCAEWFSLLGK